MPPIPEHLVQYEEREEELDIESWLNGFENWNPSSFSRQYCPMDIDSDDFEENELPIHQPSAHTVSQFLQNYSGPGTITKIKPSRKTPVSRVVDWDEDLIIPSTKLQPTSKISFKRSLSPESSWVDSSVPVYQDSTHNFRSDEEDLLLPPGVTQLKLPTEPKKAPLTIDIEGSSSDDPDIFEPTERLNPFRHLKKSQPYQQGEEFLDIIFPPASSDLQLKSHQHKNNSFGYNEENLLDGLIIPNESVFMQPTANPKITRRTVPLYPKRHAQIRDTYTSPSSKFNQRLLIRKKTPISSNIKIPTYHCPVIPAAPLAVGANSNSIVLTSPFEYGDGTELDDLDNLPVQRSFPSPMVDTQVLQLLDHFSEPRVESLSPPTKRKRVKPMLIRNLNSNKMRRVVGKMRFNPQACNWEGNEDALLDFKSVSSVRPALITNLNGHKRAHRIGNAVFDPIHLRWFTEDNEADPFEGIDDIPDHPGPFSPSNSFGPGNDFYLSPNNIDDMYTSEGKHRKFVGRWFPDPDSALLRLKYLHLGPSQSPPHLQTTRHPSHPWQNPPDPSSSSNQGSNNSDEMNRFNSTEFNQHSHNQHHPSNSPS